MSLANGIMSTGVKVSLVMRHDDYRGQNVPSNNRYIYHGQNVPSNIVKCFTAKSTATVHEIEHDIARGSESKIEIQLFAAQDIATRVPMHTLV